MRRFFYIAFYLVFSGNLCFAADNLKISFIVSAGHKVYDMALDGFNETLNKNNISYSFSKYRLDKDDPSKILSEIQNQDPDIVLVLGAVALFFANKEIKDIPVVFAVTLAESEPEEPFGPNITGVTINIPAKLRVKTLKRVFPDVKRIGILYSQYTIDTCNNISVVCKKMGLQLIKKRVDSEKEFPVAIEDIKSKIDCFLIIPDSKLFYMQSIKYLLLESLRKKFLVAGLSPFFTKSGAIISIEPDYYDLGRQAGEIVLRIINGESPSKIKYLSPRKIKFSLNVKTAKRLGIKIPSSIMKEANEVFGN